MTDTTTPTLPDFRLLSITDEPPPKQAGRPPSPYAIELGRLAEQLDNGQWACILRTETPADAKAAVAAIPSKVRAQYGVSVRGTELWMTRTPPPRRAYQRAPKAGRAPSDNPPKTIPADVTPSDWALMDKTQKRSTIITLWKDLGNVPRIAQAIGMSEATVYAALKELRTDGTLPPNAGR